MANKQSNLIFTEIKIAIPQCKNTLYGITDVLAANCISVFKVKVLTVANSNYSIYGQWRIIFGVIYLHYI